MRCRIAASVRNPMTLPCWPRAGSWPRRTRSWQGEVDNAFCAVRPPGHHAERDRALGFCFFNNVAMGAVYLLENFGLERVAIVDWDVHHGNGTQHLFEADPRVFYLSLHEDPQYCYPGTGYRRETGKGPGQGFTLNLPFPPRQRGRRLSGGLEKRGAAPPPGIRPPICIDFRGLRCPPERPPGPHEPQPGCLPADGRDCCWTWPRRPRAAGSSRSWKGATTWRSWKSARRTMSGLLLGIPLNHF